MTTCTVMTPSGKVQGELRDGLRIFRGIPYAITERFKAPQPVPKWDLFDASEPVEVECYQYAAFREQLDDVGQFYKDEFPGAANKRYDESPMTLNIIAKDGATKQPVLVFIHGGGFETGHAGDAPCGDSDVYAKQDIIYVSMDYRLNVFGLYEGENYGLQDLVFGLQWIQREIESYGGDPERITIAGQSAGAMSVMDLLYSHKLKGLVQGAITMSGGGMVPKITRPWKKEESLPFWENVRKRTPAKTREEFAQLPPDVIWNAWYDESRENYNFHAVQPAIDGVVIPDLPQTVVEEGKDLDVPMICGVTSQDFMPYVIYDMALRWGLLRAKKGRKPVYGYFFDRALPGNKFKAFHACDLWYLFGGMQASWRPFEQIDYDLSNEIIQYMSNFIKTGNPNGKGLPEWPAISKKQKGFRLCDGVSKGLISPWRCRLKEYKTFLFEKGPM